MMISVIQGREIVLVVGSERLDADGPSRYAFRPARPSWPGVSRQRGARQLSAAAVPPTLLPSIPAFCPLPPLPLHPTPRRPSLFPALGCVVSAPP